MIIPGKGTSLYKIGVHKNSIDFSTLEIQSIEKRGNLEVIKTKSIWLFVDSNTQIITQVSVFKPFEEKVLDIVGLGDFISKVHDAFGKCIINHKVHEPIQYPGVSFETEKGTKANNAVISCISVSDPYPSDILLPKHNNDNFPNKKKKLP
ncbi:hypothetical protein [Pseudoalteromonas sp. GB56]